MQPASLLTQYQKAKQNGHDGDGIKKTPSEQSNIKKAHFQLSGSRIKNTAMTKRDFDKLPESIKKQFSKPLTAIYNYLPTRKTANEMQWKVRRFVWRFKDGDHTAAMFAAETVAKNIIKQYGADAKNMTFVCVPASSGEANRKRYKEFSAKVCEMTGMTDGFSAVTVSGEKLAIHEQRKGEKKFFSTHTVEIRKKAVQACQVLLFDDIITKGMSYAQFAASLEAAGAAVVGGIFLARTIIC